MIDKVAQEINIWKKNHPKSFHLWERSLTVLAGGVSHNNRNLGLHEVGSYPNFIKEASGNLLIDVDDVNYTDYWLGHYSMLLGHRNPEVQKVVVQQLQEGWYTGALAENHLKMAETLCKDSTSIEKLRFTSSGTEATMYAVRLARAYTGRPLVAKARLGWHGASDSLTSIDHKTTSPTIEKTAEDPFGTVTFGLNIKEFDVLIDNRHDLLAAVIIEPIIGAGGAFKISDNLLHHIRERTKKFGILLITDEIITAYRFQYGLFSDALGLDPDIVTLGKTIGGGFPIGVVAGKDDILSQADPRKESFVKIGGGTFSAHPVSMTAGITTLKLLEGMKDKYQQLNNSGECLKHQLNQLFADNKASLVSTGYGSLIFVHATKHYLRPDSLPDEIMSLTDYKKESLLTLMLLNRKIFTHHCLGALSFAHKKRDLEQLVTQYSTVSQYF